MKKFYISSGEGLSGICKYSRDFYQLVLKERGYIFMDSALSTTTILSAASSRDRIHIEIGIFQKKEIEILFMMLRANYKNVSITLHDPPLLKYPFYEFRNPFLNKVSKFYDHYISRFGKATPYIRKLQSIYVLSEKGREIVKKRYGVGNVHYIPHIVDAGEIKKSPAVNNNLIYMGFIGRNKGIEYSLKLHQQLLATHPDINFYVAGLPLGKEKRFYDQLREKYKKNVHYLGYVPETQLDELFDQAGYAVQLFKNYKFFWPLNGSILYSMKKGKVLFTNPANVIPEMIVNGRNGFYLAGSLRKDVKKMTGIFTDQQAIEAMKEEMYSYLLLHHSAEKVSHSFKD